MLACHTAVERKAAFPGKASGTLHQAQLKYKLDRPDLLPTVAELSAYQPDDTSVPRHVHDKVLRELYQVKHKRADYIAAVEDAAIQAIERINIKPVPRPPRDLRRKSSAEVAVALLSDTQIGKVTPDYNSEVARERVLRYARKIVQLTEIQRAHHPIRKCVVAMLGDMVEGVDIFPGQQWLIDSTLYQQIFETTPSILVDFLRYLLAHFDEVEVWAVQGNHGRLGRKGQYGPEDNADRMVYKLVSMLMRDEPRLTFKMSDPRRERAWYMVGHIGNYSAMLIHGDQIKGANGYPWYGLGKKVGGWASGGIPEPFHDILLGHYHQLGMFPLNHRNAYANGSTESTNTFAQEMLASAGPPKQWLFFVHPEHGYVTSEHAVRLLED